MISLLRFSTCYWGGRQGSKFPFCIAITFYDTLLFVVIFSAIYWQIGCNFNHYILRTDQITKAQQQLKSQLF